MQYTAPPLSSSNDQKLWCISEIGTRMNNALLNFYAAVISQQKKHVSSRSRRIRIGGRKTKYNFFMQQDPSRGELMTLFIHMVTTPVMVGTRSPIDTLDVPVLRGILHNVLLPQSEQARDYYYHHHHYRHDEFVGDEDPMERVRQYVAVALQNLRESLPGMSLPDLFLLLDTLDARRVTKTMFEERLQHALERFDRLFLAVFDDYEVQFGTVVTPMGHPHVAVRRRYTHNWSDWFFQQVFHYTTIYRLRMRHTLGKHRCSAQRIRKLRTMDIITTTVDHDLELQMLMKASRFWTDEILDARKNGNDNHEDAAAAAAYAVWYRSHCAAPNEGMILTLVDVTLMSNLK